MQRREFFKLAAAAPYQRWVTRAEAPIPEWARTGNYVFMGLDGGPLEAEKGLRSGWPGFTRDDPQGIVQAIRDLYRPENVEIPLAAGATWIYLTWTNGWSKPREHRDQWPHAVRFLQECRKHGIHASAYISAANMFWEDYLQQVPESRKWIDTAEPSLVRHYGSSMYRVMANIRLPEWRSQIKESIDAALDAGFEGFWVDNLFWWHGESLFADFLAEMRTHAARRRSGVVWHVNVNTGICNWGRAGNVVGTEDGKVPRFVPSKDPPLEGNLGLLSLVSGLREGWRPAIMEHYGNDLSPATRQLMIAECWMWQTGATWFPDSYLLPTQWHRREPAAWRILEAMGTYNRHYLRYREYFQEGEPVATVGIVGHPGSSGGDVAQQQRTAREQGEFVKLLDKLAAWKVQYEVLFEDRLSPEVFRKFSLVVVTAREQVSPGTWGALESYRRAGGGIIEVELPQVRPQSLRDEIFRRPLSPVVDADAPPAIVFRALRQRAATTVHLVNYATQPMAPFSLRFQGQARTVEVLIPESNGPHSLAFRQEGPVTVVAVPEFPIHCLLRFQTG